MKITPKQLVTCAALLAICLLSTYLKTLSVYITGPIVNACIILATIFCGLLGGILLSIATPVAAYFIASSPITQAVPLIVPMIMLGNCVLAFAVWIFYHKLHFRLHMEAGLIVGSLAKAAFMWLIIVRVILHSSLAIDALGAKYDKLLAVASSAFSVTQLITALIGSALAVILYYPLKAVSGQNE